MTGEVMSLLNPCLLIIVALKDYGVKPDFLFRVLEPEILLIGIEPIKKRLFKLFHFSESCIEIIELSSCVYRR
jgi:hypothetical protein